MWSSNDPARAPVIRVVESPSAEARIAAALAFVAAQPPATEVMVVGASREAADDLARRATVAAGATFGIHRASLAPARRPHRRRRSGLGRATCPRARSGPRRWPPGSRSKRSTRARSATSRRWPAFPASPGRWPPRVGELRLAGVAPERVGALAATLRAGAGGPRRRSSRRATSASCWPATRTALRAGGLADRAALFDLAAGRCCRPAARRRSWRCRWSCSTSRSRRRPRRRSSRPLVAAIARRPRHRAGRRRPHPRGARLARRRRAPTRRRARRPGGRARADAASALGRLRAHLFSDAAPRRAAVTGDVVFFSAPGEGREAVEIARLRPRGGAGRDALRPDGDPAARAARVREPARDGAGARRRSPRGSRAARAGPTRPGARCWRCLDCALEKLSARRFAEYLSLGQVPPLEADGAPPRAAERWVAPEDEVLAPEPLGQEPPVPEAPAGAPARPPSLPSRSPTPTRARSSTARSGRRGSGSSSSSTRR